VVARRRLVLLGCLIVCVPACEDAGEQRKPSTSSLPAGTRVTDGPDYSFECDVIELQTLREHTGEVLPLAIDVRFVVTVSLREDVAALGHRAGDVVSLGFHSIALQFDSEEIEGRRFRIDVWTDDDADAYHATATRAGMGAR
jgi:hypothetical protein